MCGALISDRPQVREGLSNILDPYTVCMHPARFRRENGGFIGPICSKFSSSEGNQEAYLKHNEGHEPTSQHYQHGARHRKPAIEARERLPFDARKMYYDDNEKKIRRRARAAAIHDIPGMGVLMLLAVSTMAHRLFNRWHITLITAVAYVLTTYLMALAVNYLV
jgi:hypothetical protein